MWWVTVRGLTARKLRFLLTAIAVVLGVAFISGTLVLTATIQRSFDDLFSDINRGTDAVVRSPRVLDATVLGGTDATRSTVPESLVSVVRGSPDVAAAFGSVETYAQVVDAHGKVVDGNGAPSFGLGWIRDPRINQLRIVRGRAPRTSGEIVIDRYTADRARLHVGDRVVVLTTRAPRKYTVVGIARFGNADSLLGASITAFTMPQAQKLANAVGRFSQISVVARHGVSQSQLATSVGQRLASRGLLQYEVVTGADVTKENQNAVRDFLSLVRWALVVFAVVALVVGAFIIYNTFSIVVAQRMREMALLRALGATRAQVLSAVMVESLIVGAVASAVGVVAGVALSLGLRDLVDAIGLRIPSSGVVVPPSAVATGLLVGIFVTLLSAVLPARQAGRVPPVAALRQVESERPVNHLRRGAPAAAAAVLGGALLYAGLFGGRGITDVGLGAVLLLVAVVVASPLFTRQLAYAIGEPLSRLRGITGRLARENAARNPRRTAVTGAAVMIAVSLVGFITIFAASANASISSAIDKQLRTDFVITSGRSASSGLSPDLARRLAALPQVRALTPIRIGMIGVAGARSFVAAADPAAAAQLFDFRDVVGSFDRVRTDGIAVSKHVADQHRWHVGDDIPVTFAKTGVVPLRIDDVYERNGLAGDYLVSLTTFERNFDQQLDFQIFLKLEPGVSAAQARRAIAPALRAYPNAKLDDEAQYKADQRAQINSILVLVYVLLFLAVVIAVIGITNTMTLSIYERTRELGLLRAIGGARSQVRSTIRWEAVIIALLGMFLGIVVAVFFGWAVVRALRDQGFDTFSFAPLQLVVIVLAGGVLAVVAALVPARRAAQLDVLEALAAR